MEKLDADWRVEIDWLGGGARGKRSNKVLQRSAQSRLEIIPKPPCAPAEHCVRPHIKLLFAFDLANISGIWFTGRSLMNNYVLS